jgi:hypothetical protein
MVLLVVRLHERYLLCRAGGRGQMKGPNKNEAQPAPCEEGRGANSIRRAHMQGCHGRSVGRQSEVGPATAPGQAPPQRRSDSVGCVSR